MADTSYLTRVVEPFLVQWVGTRLGVPLSKRKIAIGKGRTGRVVSFEIDGLSEDGAVAVFASAAGSIKPGQVRKLFMDAAILIRLPAARRVMVFADEEIWTGFSNSCDGLLDLGLIEPVVCDALPAEMRERIAAIRRIARDEVGDRGRAPRIPGERR